MARKKSETKGIFCLETDQWFRQKDRATVEPALHLLERYGDVPYEHRDVGTESEFVFFLDRYFRRGYKTHPILYLGFHGWKAEGKERDAFVEIGDGTRITLAQLEEWIDGRARGRLIYFGACGVMDSHGNRLNRFVRNTQAVAVCGYREEVDWLESAAFDALALGALQESGFTKSSIQKFDREIDATAPGLYRRLGFRTVVKS